MRSTAARLNRAWLTIIGILALLGGLVVVAIGTGLLAPAAAALGITLSKPSPDNRLAGQATAAALGTTWVVLVVALVAVVLAVLGLAWLIAQIPRTHEAKPFRLHDDARTGLTRCEPSVLTDAVEAQIEGLSGVQKASAVLRGTAAQPELTVRVTAADRTDLPRLLSTLQNRVAADLSTALDTDLRRLAVQIEVDTSKPRADRITV